MDEAAYGLWFLVVVNSVVLIIFAASFFHPRSRRDWRAMGAFSAFIVALFTEMYGVPLTVYLLSGWLGERFPALKATHAGGHLWNDLIGWRFDPHISPFHLASYVFIIGGFWLISAAWKVLWEAQRNGTLAVSGPYEKVRHPQYAGFLLIMVGFLLQWPTIPTLLMFPVLLVVYRRLAISEEKRSENASEASGSSTRHARLGSCRSEMSGRMTGLSPPRRALLLRSSQDDDVQFGVAQQPFATINVWRYGKHEGQ